jgi:hypothetical protein
VFDVVSRGTKILIAASTCGALGVRAREPDHANDKVSGTQIGNCRSGVDNLRKTLVSEDEIVQPGLRSAIDEAANFTVGAANSDFQNAQFNLIVCLDTRFSDINQLDRALPREHCHGFQ